MEYSVFNNTFYIRVDKGDEIIACIINVCKKEKITSATFCGIGGCGMTEIQTFIPETGTFETKKLTGMLELISVNGNITTDETNKYFHHAHALFSYKQNGRHRLAGGHMKTATVLYTAEIELRPVIGGTIKRKYDKETGTGFWSFPPTDR